MTRRRWGVVLAACVTACLASSPMGAQTPQWPAERPPSAIPMRPIAFPAYQLKTLANGLQVLVIPRHEEPSVSFRLIIKAGAAEDPPDKPGVAGFVAALLAQGTTTRSSETIADTIESAGGVFGVGSTTELSYVNAGVVKDRFAPLIDLASDLVQHPAFAPQEIARQREQALSSLTVSHDEAGVVADLAFDRLVFGAHPYGRPGNGTPESVRSITRTDLVAFHAAWFAPNNAILAIVGDLSADEAFAAAERGFGTWAKHDVPRIATPDPPDPAPRIVVIDKPGAVQTEIRVGHLGVPRTHVDYVALNLAIRILGGEGANRLFNDLRTDRALTYGASADMQALKLSGDFVAQTSTRSEATGETLRLVVDEFQRLQRDPVDARELSGAQDYLAGSFPLTIETPSQIALQVLNRLFYGIDVKELETFRATVEAVTVADISRVTRQFLMPNRLSIVLVGDASKFLQQLTAQHFTEVEVIPLDQFDATSATLRRAGK
jgi:zinc protease